MGGGSRGGHLHSQARDTGELGDGSSAAGARAIPSLAWLHARVHYAGQLGQCAGHAPCNAAQCSGVLGRLPTIRGSLEASPGDAFVDADHVVQLRRVRLHHPVELNQTGLHDLVPMSLPIPDLTTGLATLQAIESTQMSVPIVLLHQSAPAMPQYQPI